MEEILFDEILQEIFTRLPSSSSSLPTFESVPLVSKRWLRLYRASKTSMSLRVNPHDSSVITFLPSILHNHPSLSSLWFVSDPKIPILFPSAAESNFNDHLISIVSSRCFNLRKLCFLVNPLPPSSLLPLSTSLSLTSLSLKLLGPVSFNWVASFPSLKDLSVDVCSRNSSGSLTGSNPNPEVVELGLESVSLTGIQSDDTGVTWLWRRCRKLKKLCLKSCETIGETELFALCLKNVEEIELRTCRSIVDVVLLKVSEICESLNSLLIYDGGNKDGLVHFMNNSRCNDTLKTLDLRLPMDLMDEHLVSLAASFKSLSALRLTSCYFVTGHSLKILALSFCSSLEELSLRSCDAVEREPGVVSMLASCSGLVELDLRGCKNLTGSVLVSLNKSCVELRSLDIASCRLIQAGEVEAFVMKSQRLKKIVVEENKITEAAMRWASSKLIDVVALDSDVPW
uniref:F-box domain-containing protein n=1 Tax=Brassica oleracea var. oleracea TaxID=109376 RepID=A0A0D3C078_BRAOL